MLRTTSGVSANANEQRNDFVTRFNVSRSRQRKSNDSKRPADKSNRHAAKAKCNYSLLSTDDGKFIRMPCSFCVFERICVLPRSTRASHVARFPGDGSYMSATCCIILAVFFSVTDVLQKLREISVKKHTKSLLSSALNVKKHARSRCDRNSTTKGLSAVYQLLIQ